MALGGSRGVTLYVKNKKKRFNPDKGLEAELLQFSRLLNPKKETALTD